MASRKNSASGRVALPSAFERNTRQRRNMRAAFENAERPLSIEEVLAAARRGRNAVSLSTVYRFVRSLVDDGSLSAIEVPGRGVFYELAGKAHHHHFSCLSCGRIYEINDCVGLRDLVLPEGFHAVSHDITVEGVCSACHATLCAARSSGG
jgi:Fur family ferric uptake transcriptional regulator